MIFNTNNHTYNQSTPLIKSQNIADITNNDIFDLIYDFFINFPLVTSIQCFILTFFSLLCDKSYILLIIIKKKFPKSTLIFFAFLFSILLLNTIIILLGRLFDFFLYKNLIEFFAEIIVGFIGIKYFFKFFYRQKRKSYNQEINYILSPSPKLGIDFATNQSRKTSKILNYDKKDDFIFRHYYEPHYKIFLFYTFSKIIFCSILGNVYTYLILVDSALSDFIGVITGSSLAILIVVYFGCYQANFIARILSEAKTGAIVSLICLTAGIEIYAFSSFNSD